jgi:FdrA protein
LLGLEDSDGTVVVRGTLEGGAIAAAELAGHPLKIDQPGGTPAPTRAQGTVLGLYTGGTLAAEAKTILGRAGVVHEVLDLGDDEYTAGRPHPMIDPAERSSRVAQAGSRADVGVLIIDLVLGHGASDDPAAPLAEAVRVARAAASADGRDLVVTGSVCGTAGDPQDIEAQRTLLREAGVVLFLTNAGAARYAVACATTGPDGVSTLKGKS